MKKILRIILLLILLGLGYGFYYLYVRMPIINGYAAKNLCSCMFEANRSQEFSEQNDLNFSFIKYTNNEVDSENKKVTSTFWGMQPQTAVYHNAVGCVLTKADEIDLPEINTQEWMEPSSEDDFTMVHFDQPLDYPKLRKAINDHFEENVEGVKKNTRAVIVLHDGKMVAEQYAEGFDENSKQLGWSMTKSIMSTLVGILVRDGRLSVDQKELFDAWTDERKEISLADLLHMNSGLEWVEDYGSISDVTTMLYDSEDILTFAIDHKLEDKPGTVWKYSSGTSNLIAGVIKSKFDYEQSYLEFPYQRLFGPLGMKSMLLETDASGLFVGSSYSWATARDWAKYGQLYLNEGNWYGKQIIDTSWVEYTQQPAEGSNHRYGAQFWLVNPELFPGIPEDMYYADGFQGQRIFIIPSKKLVIVRLGISNQGNVDFISFIKGVVEAVE